jgi:uncharacterized protein YndB with AHSA1/START domain
MYNSTIRLRSIKADGQFHKRSINFKPTAIGLSVGCCLFVKNLILILEIIMENQLILTVKTTINAPISTVWDALTNPITVKKWFFGTDLKTTWEVGTPILWSGEWEGKPYEDKGIVLGYEHEKYAKYNYWSSFSGTEDIPENYANISYEVTDNENHTELTIIQDGFKNEEAMAHSEANWKAMMEEMKKLIDNV